MADEDALPEALRLQLEREAQRFGFWYSVIRWLAPVAWIAAAAIPIIVAEPIARDLAGKNTNFALSISISLVFNLTLVGTTALLLYKNRQQARELERLRSRVRELESGGT